jgi:hypothetical protein
MNTRLLNPTSTRSPGLLATLLPVALLVGCAGSHDPAPRPVGPLPDGDATSLASWVDRACRAPATAVACREAALVRIAEDRGIGIAMDVVSRLDVSDGEGHGLAHMVGIRGYRGQATAGESLAACTTLYQSGCYHGVVQAYFSELAQGNADVLDGDGVGALCAPYRDRDADRWLLFQCLHGVGHGVMLVHGGHLPNALEACDLLPVAWEREVCYGGAFMENVMSVIAPHHAHVGPPAGHHEHGAPATDDAGQEPPDHDPHGHEHHAPEHHGHRATPAEPFAPIDPDDLHYPCSALDARYQLACYDMQTATMLHLLDHDIGATAAACREAPDPILRSVCHRSLGRDINAMTNRDHRRSADLCALAGPSDRPSCHTGVVKNVIDVTADVATGIPYCSLTPAGPEREACFRAIGEQAAVLIAEAAGRARLCDGLTGADREACRQGAGASG